MVIARRFSITNFAIATSALCFQVFVLYPWHRKLDEHFEQFKQEHLRALRENEQARAGELAAVMDLLETLPKRR
jgi:hypothetical protein